MRTLAALLIIPAVAFAQSAAPPACSIDGSVVNSLTGVPVLRAAVNLIGADETITVESDAAGKWSVEHISCGRVSVSVTRVGYLRVQQNTAPTPALVLLSGVPLHDVKLELSPQSVIVGRVLDDHGDPIQGALVSLMTSRISNGVRGLLASMSAPTNDLGEYRFAGLNAGKYLVCATAAVNGAATGNISKAYGEKCYPGAMDASPPITMDITTGYEGRVDFTLTPLSTVQVRGVVSGMPDGANVAVSLISRALPGMAGRMGMGLSAAMHKDGTFVIKNIPPGAYTVRANSIQLSRRLTALAPVDVGGNDVEGIQLRLEPGVTLTGAVRIVSVSGKKLGPSQFTVLLRSAEIGTTQAIWDQSRTSFTMPDIIPGSYRLEFTAPAPLYMKSATIGGRDIAGSDITVGQGTDPIEVVVSDDGGIVEGDVLAGDAPAAGWVLLQRENAPPRNVRTDANGHFKIDTVPPGDYQVYAWDSNNIEYANQDWMRRNGNGVAVTVQAAQTAQVKLVRQSVPAE